MQELKQVEIKVVYFSCMLTALAIFIHVFVYINYMTSSKNTALLNNVDVVNDVDVKTSPGCSYSMVFFVSQLIPSVFKCVLCTYCSSVHKSLRCAAAACAEPNCKHLNNSAILKRVLGREQMVALSLQLSLS